MTLLIMTLPITNFTFKWICLYQHVCNVTFIDVISNVFNLVSNNSYAYPICLNLEEVVVHTGRKVLMEVDNNISLIVGDARGILDQQLSFHPIRDYNFFN